MLTLSKTYAVKTKRPRNYFQPNIIYRKEKSIIFCFPARFATVPNTAPCAELAKLLIKNDTPKMAMMPKIAFAKKTIPYHRLPDVSNAGIENILIKV